MDLSTLNPQQRQAVQHGDGPLLVLAGAGSGKTRVITFRMAYLVRQRGADPASLLAVTFTNKAAREMQERVGQLVAKEAAAQMTVATYHALALRLLKADIHRLGYKRTFSIYDPGDQQRLVRELAADLLPPGMKADPGALLARISSWKNRLRGPDAVSIDPRQEMDRLALEVYPRYQKRLRAHNAVDFDDLLLLAVRLLEEHDSVRSACRARYRHLLVDEYQDTNPAQYRLLRLLAGDAPNLCVVGDDDQSIYGWRGADVGNILRFEQDFPGTKVIRLEQNYRSTGSILRAANAVIRHNSLRKEKNLWSAGGDGERLQLWRCPSDEEEAQRIAEWILAEQFRGARRYGDFAVLYRTNAQSRAFEEQLRYQNIPYELIGGQQFFDRKEVRDVLAYLRLLRNPFDEVALLRILNYPRRGIGDSSAERLIAHSAEVGRPLWLLLKQLPVGFDLPEKAKEAIAGFVALIERFQERFARGSLVEALRQMLTEIRLADEICRGVQDLVAARKRLENVDEVVNALAAYVARQSTPNLDGFLDSVSLLDDGGDNSDDKEKKVAGDSVTLMSLHSSKGLEFPVVFLVGLEEELLPHGKSGTDIAEERRLCYVGITRAREQLILSYAQKRKKHGQLEVRLRSRFLDEIPDDLVQLGDMRPPATPEQEEQTANRFFAGISALFEEDE